MRKTFFYVYFAANISKMIYTGMTNDIRRRMYEHKNKVNDGFTKKYNINKLVYFEEFPDPSSAIRREKQMKNWHREWKINLIEKTNPTRMDLSHDWFK